MKLEAGMYVRTDNGEIANISNPLKEFHHDYYNSIKGVQCDRDENDFYHGIWYSEIKKASHNIIDLIEVGDYVNGSFVEDVYYMTEDKKVLELEGETDNCKCLPSDEIKEILTKEQYEANVYKIV